MDNLIGKIGIIKDGIIKFVTREEARKQLTKSSLRPADAADKKTEKPDAAACETQARTRRLSDDLVDSLWIGGAGRGKYAES